MDQHGSQFNGQFPQEEEEFWSYPQPHQFQVPPNQHYTPQQYPTWNQPYWGNTAPQYQAPNTFPMANVQQTGPVFNYPHPVGAMMPHLPTEPDVFQYEPEMEAVEEDDRENKPVDTKSTNNQSTTTATKKHGQRGKAAAKANSKKDTKYAGLKTNRYGETPEVYKKAAAHRKAQRISGLKGFIDDVLGPTGTDFEDAGIVQTAEDAMKEIGIVNEGALKHVKKRMIEFLNNHYQQKIVDARLSKRVARPQEDHSNDD